MNRKAVPPFFMGVIFGMAIMWVLMNQPVSRIEPGLDDNMPWNESVLHSTEVTSILRRRMPTVTTATITPASFSISEQPGWHPIHVFYGDASEFASSTPHEQQEPTTWFAQVQQDRTILDLMETSDSKTNKNNNSSGYYFVDLAANDAKEFSNTLALEQHGWQGLCIEPNPVYWYGLSHRKCHVAGVVVGGRTTSSSLSLSKVNVKFRGVYGGIVGNMDDRLANRKKEPKAPMEQRYTTPLEQVLDMFHVPPVIDYLSLDVEGAEYLVMKDFPFSQYQIRILTVERPSQPLRTLLEAHGFVFLKDLAWWGETLWAHNSTGFTPDHPKIVKIKTEGK